MFLLEVRNYNRTYKGRVLDHWQNRHNTVNHHHLFEIGRTWSTVSVNLQDNSNLDLAVNDIFGRYYILLVTEEILFKMKQYTQIHSRVVLNKMLLLSEPKIRTRHF